MLRGVIILLLSATTTGALAQLKDVGTPPDKKVPTTLQPVNPVKYYGPRKEKKKKKGKPVTYTARDEYDDRVEKVWQEQEKREKRFEQGETMDQMKPPYFGHKKPPKVRPIGKRKQCRVCGIRH